MSVDSASSTGGRAGAAGYAFQHRVAAWCMVGILAEAEFTPRFGLASNAYLDSVECEAGRPVDDVNVWTSVGGFIGIQAKRTLNISARHESALAAVCRQFVRQFAAGVVRDRQQEDLDPHIDRLVLAISSDAPRTISLHLRDLLNNFRRSRGRSVEDVATNAEQRRVGHILWDHLAREVGLQGNGADLDVASLLPLLHVWQADVESEGAEENRALDTLRRSVLVNREQARSTWDVLKALAQEIGDTGEVLTRLRLQEHLNNLGLDTLASPSWRADIETLREATERHQELARLGAFLTVDGRQVPIVRSVADDLKEAAEVGHVLIVGEPGSGKSTLLLQAAERLIPEADCVYLNVDQLAGHSVSEISRELGLDHDIVDVMANWPGSRGYFFLDGLDASRGSAARRALMDFVRLLRCSDSRWGLIASIRAFDMKHDADMADAFMAPITACEGGSHAASATRLVLENLDDDELRQLESAAPTLNELIERSGPQDLDLLRNPFNLSLASALGMNAQPASIGEPNTRVGLLDQYWTRRVRRRDGQTFFRDQFARRVCASMIESGRLRTRVSDVVAAPGDSDALTDLLREGVLCQDDFDETVFFSHHIVFDYASEKLFLEQGYRDLAEQLAVQPTLSLTGRPGLVLRFERLWSADSNRASFWEATFALSKHHGVPAIAQVIPVQIAAINTQAISDVRALVFALAASDPDRAAAARLCYRFLVGTLIASQEGAAPLAGPGAGPWCELVDAVSAEEEADIDAMFATRALVNSLVDLGSDVTATQLSHLGRTSRRILDYGWNHYGTAPLLVRSGLQNVCRTFATEPAESESLLRRCIEPDHLAAEGYRELFWIVQELGPLVSLAPAFVRDLFIATFSYEEKSDEPVPMGGALLTLISNRRQDYDHAVYQLAEFMPTFLSESPVEAVEALVGALEVSSIRQDRWNPDGSVFEFRGRLCEIVADHSHIWAAPGTVDSEEEKLLRAFSEWIEPKLADPEDPARETTLATIVGRNRSAIMWRTLLELGAAFPDTLGRDVAELLQAREIVSQIDTAHAAVELMRSVHPLLTVATRTEIERVIVQLGSTGEPEWYERQRDRLIGCVPIEALVTEEARSIRATIEADAGPPENVHPFVMGPITSSPYSRDRRLRERGVDPARPANQTLISEVNRLQGMLGEQPDYDDSERSLAAARAVGELFTRVSDADGDEPDPLVLDEAWIAIAQIGERVARTALECDNETVERVMAALLGAASHRLPEQSSDSFDTSPSWGVLPRTEAASALTYLARHRSCARPEVLAAIDRLSQDPVTAVRFQPARHLAWLRESAPGLMWEIAGRSARAELSYGVLQGLVGALGELAGNEPSRCADLLATVFSRIDLDRPGAEELHRLTLIRLAGLSLFRDMSVASDVVDQVVQTIDVFPARAHPILSPLREGLTYGGSGTDDGRAVRERCVSLLGRIVAGSRAAIGDLTEGRDLSALDEGELAHLKELISLIESAGSQLYFASGVFDSRRGRDAPPRHEVERLFAEAESVIDELCQVGTPHLAHELIELLGHMAYLHPTDALRRISRVVVAAEPWKYVNDQQAAEQLITLACRFVTEFRQEVLGDEDCQAMLVDMLSRLVEAGWPEALSFAHRLHEAFR